MNITYDIDESGSVTDDDKQNWPELELEDRDNTTNTCNIIDTGNIIDNEFYARELDYKLNYTVKHLISIIDYYGIKKVKLNKDMMINKILEFEINKDNIQIVERRKLLFNYMAELKNDNYFRKYIIYNI